MKRIAWIWALCALVLPAFAIEPSAVEQEVTEAVKSSKVTIVHLWAPWCPNCTAELKHNGWTNFLEQNPDVNVVFVTVWAGEQGDGRSLLEKHGLGSQPNFKLLVHPNASRKKADKMTHFLGNPVTWIPTTWVYRGGTLRFALNYGEVRFDMLQQMVKDAGSKW